MFKVGQFLGFFSLNLGSDGQTVTRGSRALIRWANFASLFQAFGYLGYSIFYLTFFKIDELYFTMLSFILSLLQVVIFVTFIFITHLNVIFSRKYILKVVTFAKNLKNAFALLEIDKDESCQKVLLYANCVHIMVGLVFVTAIAILMTTNLFLYPSFMEFLSLILETVSWVTFVFVISIYCISFSFGFFQLRKLMDNLSPKNCHILSIHHFLLLKFLRKVNHLMQTILMLALFDGFVGLVGDVSSDLI